MELSKFIAHHGKLNDKEVKKHGCYAEEFVWVEHISGDHKVDFLGLYNEVIGREILGDVIIDENIGFIVCDCMYIDKSFLERLKEKGIKEYLNIVGEWDLCVEEFQRAL